MRGWLAAIRLRWQMRDGIRCPLCVDTPRAWLTYPDGTNLTLHALQVHEFEAIYEWTRTHMAEHSATDEDLQLLDISFRQVETFTTTYTVSHRMDADVPPEFGWMCRRCWSGDSGFLTIDAAQADRYGHRCPL